MKHINRKTIAILSLVAGVVMLLTPRSGSLAPALWFIAFLVLALALVLLVLEHRKNTS
jgi:uncharacterized membrane protein HdeD (DUF308 family)